MAKKRPQKLEAVDLTRGTTIALPTGGSRVATKGEVLLVPNEISETDARYLCGMNKAEPCDPRLKAERAKKAAEKKDEK